MMLWMPSRKSESRSSSLEAVTAAAAAAAADGAAKVVDLEKRIIDQTRPQLQKPSWKYNCIKAYDIVTREPYICKAATMFIPGHEARGTI